MMDGRRSETWFGARLENPWPVKPTGLFPVRQGFPRWSTNDRDKQSKDTKWCRASGLGMGNDGMWRGAQHEGAVGGAGRI